MVLSQALLGNAEYEEISESASHGNYLDFLENSARERSEPNRRSVFGWISHKQSMQPIAKSTWVLDQLLFRSSPNAKIQEVLTVSNAIDMVRSDADKEATRTRHTCFLL